MTLTTLPAFYRLSSLAIFWALKTRLPAFLCIAALASTGCTQEQPKEPDKIDLAALRVKYETDASRYKMVDGVELHYTDEGQGAPLVILHPSFLNLSVWDGIAGRLVQDYRVIRFDFPGQGLSSVDQAPPTGEKIDFTERNADITAKLLAALDVDNVYMIATSTGASAGFRYASYYPDRVKRLILINSAGMPRMAWTNPNRAFQSRAKWAKLRVKPKEFWTGLLERNFIAPNKPPPWLIDLAFDVNRRDDRAPPGTYSFKTGDPQKILAGIKAPTLLLWGLENPTVMHLEADVMAHWMTGAPTLLKKYARAGHYPYVEREDLTYADIAAFFAGDLDSELRQTQRVKVPLPAR